jgi:protein tyrosine phosphatase (PTP) superfamily phosphohydrolase (DUF442 family)
MDLSAITDTLYVAARPQSADAAELTEHGVRLVLNMIPVRTPRGLRTAPLRACWLPWLDSAMLPLPTWLLRRGTRVALQAMGSNEAVLIYCREGRHRSVAMACAILIAQGMSAEQAMAHVKGARPIADPTAPHVESAIRRFEASWKTGRREHP